MVAATNAGVVVGLGWREPDAHERSELFQVLRFRGGKVIDIEDHRDRAKAFAAVGAAT